MPINHSSTTEWIEANKEFPDVTYSYADVCTLIHMAKNEISRMYVHESVLDEDRLAGYADYSYLNDDEVRLLIKHAVDTCQQTNDDKYAAEITELKLQYKSDLLKLQNKEAEASLKEHLEAVKTIQFTSVGGDITDGTSKQENMVL